jgi:NTE family protein
MPYSGRIAYNRRRSTLPMKFQLLPLGLALALVTGCTSYTRPPTPKLDTFHQGEGYYGPQFERPDNSRDVVFLLALSGGGTRAASLSYGVLKELNATPVPGHDGRSLLQEVDGISSVSGGSVTAAAYAVLGDRIFTEYESRFLKVDVQGKLVSMSLNPFNWPRLWSGLAGRSDLAADYYDRILFNNVKFGDLSRDKAPYIVINATDISTGARFEFNQFYFDLICGDISKMNVSRAVAASSAVPVVLSPITLDNHGGECGYIPPEWMTEPESEQPHRLAYRVRELESFGDSRTRPYIHLVDGGVSDNLGLRAIFDGMIVKETTVKPGHQPTHVRKVVVLFVNAEHRPKQNWDTKPHPPGILNLGVRSSSIPMAKYTYESIELMREKLDQWKRIAEERGADKRGLEFYLIEVSFEQVANETERTYFHELPTSFVLPPEAVDKLRDVGGQLLRDSPEFKRLLADFSDDPAAIDARKAKKTDGQLYRRK